ncbi:glycosyltransferase [Caviibacterium pharyngocola]|uniref:Glycosyltransferase n=1 Tax=Caviibacterium pharyngocola TaxID=28159 RepID=A0A2M8RWA0_9PAST|nr:glycosyltransferase [Caviibacterium pharyngocola]
MQNRASSRTEMLNVLRLYDQFLIDYPERFVAYHNRAELLKQLGLYELALRDTEHCLSHLPNFAMAWCNKAFLLNALGRYQEGWQCYEWRWKTDVATFQDPGWPIPRWQGEDIGQNKLLIYAEQGLGDNIQFVRYALEAKRRGMNVVVVNHSPLENLLNYNLELHGVPYAANNSAIGGLTCYVSMMSLPHYFATTLDNIPYPNAYLQAQPTFIEKWKSALPSGEKLKIGVVWQGSDKHLRNHQRSLNFSHFQPLFSLPAEFHCLQKTISPDDVERSQRYPNLHLWSQHIDDFSDTAGLIEQMDLAISVDTSVAHLAAAMGKPTWILLSYHPDFRWLLQREDSPWYHSVRLFRQSGDYQWTYILDKLYRALVQKIQQREQTQ